MQTTKSQIYLYFLNLTPEASNTHTQLYRLCITIPVTIKDMSRWLWEAGKRKVES